MKGKCGFSAALGMPNDTMLYTCIEFFLDSQGCKKLRVPHDMFLQSFDAILVCSLHIGKSIFQKHIETGMSEQRSQHSIGRRVFTNVKGIFLCSFDCNQVVVHQNGFFDVGVNRANRTMYSRIFFTKTVKEQLLIAAGCIERTFDWFHIVVIVLHVVGEHHNLCDVGKPTKYLFGKPLVHTSMLCNDAIPIVWFLHFNECQRQTIDQQCNIRAKLIFTILVCQLCYYMI